MALHESSIAVSVDMPAIFIQIFHSEAAMTTLQRWGPIYIHGDDSYLYYDVIIIIITLMLSHQAVAWVWMKRNRPTHLMEKATGMNETSENRKKNTENPSKLTC